MSKFIYLLFLLFHGHLFSQPGKNNLHNWQQQARNVTIIRDDYGVPHVYGKTDAACAFGLMYAQCEDNFWQIEETFIRSLGRASELYGERTLEQDAVIALFECVKKGKILYNKADPLIKKLCKAGADAINYYASQHPGKKRLLPYYEPWFFLMSSPASPAAHGIPRGEMKNNFATVTGYDNGLNEWLQQKETGSNAMALAPSKTKSGKSMLLINPHVAFFGEGQRYETHLVSEEGLNVSGFAMLGNFYIWSGFNENAGWAHTNTASDYEDVYLENFDHPADPSKYRYGNGYLTETKWYDTILYKEGNDFKKKIFLFRKTHHGPVVAIHDSLPVTVKNASDDPAEYILQCWEMCRAANIKQFTAAMNKAQHTTNTMYADRFGNIAYWHGNAIPRRNASFDWQAPVDGSDPSTEWMGKHNIDEIIHVINPSTGWIQNCNTSPFESSGASSPHREGLPGYMSYEEENFRSEEAKRLLSAVTKISFNDFQQLVMSNHLPMMASWLPAIIKAYDRRLAKDPALNNVKGVMDTLRNWDHRYSLNSQATTLGVYLYYAYNDWIRQDRGRSRRTTFTKNFNAPDSIAVALIRNAVDDLIKTYGSAFIAWGDINRLQRIHSSGTLEKFNDNKPSIPVASVPGMMGSLFAFNTRTDPGQKKLYGISGNTYVAVIEFGKKIKAKSIHYFGQSSDPTSPHYFDQAPLYARGEFKEAYFYKEEVLKHAERIYHPGE